MARYLSTSAITDQLEGLIKGATRRVVLISPYLRLNDRVKSLIAERGRSGAEVDVVFGKEDLQLQEEAWLRSQPHVRISFLKNLHAKCYFNESHAIVGSMNLHQYSQQNNVEMGVLISKVEDKVAFADLTKDAEALIATANAGACIRCGGSIPRDPMQPHCTPCRTVWEKYSNPDYEEKFCHICREPVATTRRKPACYDCFQRYRSTLTFALAPVPPNMRMHLTKPRAPWSFLRAILTRLRR